MRNLGPLWFAVLLGCGSAGDEGASDTAATTAQPEPLTCAPEPASTDPERRDTVIGDNGSFTDACDDLGNLVEYVCELVPECDDPNCFLEPNGQVVPSEHDCAGECTDGTCYARCPAFGDLLRYVEVAGEHVVFESAVDARRYDCMLVFDEDGDTHDCADDPAVGDETIIGSLGLTTSRCTGTAIGNIGTGDPQQCGWSCTRVIP